MLTTSIIYTSAILNVSNAYAWKGVATEITQYLNFGQLSLQYAKQIQQYATQLQQLNNEIQQYINMVKNTVNLPNEIWAKFAGKISQIVQIYKDSSGIVSTLMNADDELKQIYKNYDFYRIKNMGVKDYFLQYSYWNKSNSQMFTRMMKLIGTQANSFENEQSVLKELLDANRGDTGQKQALQIGNQLTGMMIQQMQELRKLIMGQNELFTKVKAQEEEEKARSKAMLEKALAPLYSNESPVIDGNEQGY
ncbi:MAG: P-type conjugative transfer protein TrbJ [Pseudomonadota bacterium]|jgi:P-type conjugative transfer protein TrbJ